MGGLLQKAVSRLDSTPLSAVADTLAFETHDAGRLAQRLELENHGQARGARNEPASSASSFDSIEHTIISEIESYRKAATDRVTRSIEAYSSRLQAFDFEQAHLDVVAAIEDAKSTFKAEVHQGRNELFQKRRAVIGTDRDIKDFQDRHAIRRQAHLPNSRLLIWGVFLALFLGEFILNATMFAGGLAGGLLEGAGIAAGTALLNVALGGATGLLVVRFLLYRNLLAKAIAAIVLAVDLAACVILALLLARFRTAIGGADPEASLQAAFDLPPMELLSSLIDFSGYQSFLLIGLGIGAHLFAIYEGFHLDDPYPFYGKYWRKREEAETDYAETKESLIEFLTDQRDKTINEMQDASRGLASSRRVAARIRENRALTAQRFESYLTSLERMANQLLMMYREANKRARNLPAPTYFDAGWFFPSRAPLLVAGVAIVNDDISQQTIAHIEHGIRDVNESYVAAVTQYQQIQTALEEELGDGKAPPVPA